ncbi:small acid-soluble spore protein [Peptococcaceae bacterium 1198_IL3148]
MGHKKDFDELRTKRMLGQLQYESAKELGLGEEHRQLNKRMDALKRTKCKVELAEANLGAEGARKARLNIKD